MDGIAQDFRIKVVVSGRANGADKLGERWAMENGIEVDIHKADWARYKRGAGPRRNAEMAEVSDVAVGFWDGKSSGTGGMIKICKGVGVQLFTKGYNTISLHDYLHSKGEDALVHQLEDTNFCVPDDWSDEFFSKYIGDYISGEGAYQL